MNLKDIIRLVTPPVFIHLAKQLRGNRLALSGDYHSWEEAMAASTGYDSERILEKTRTSLLKVKDGEAVYERDSVLFDEIQYSWPLLAGLMWVAAKSGGRLNVLDFGGSLGSSYFQNRAFICQLPNVHWNIVEQPAHVREGKRLFENEQLRFYESIEECLSHTTPNVVVLSSVLQYLEYPYDLLSAVLKLSGICVIIDRTPYWSGDYDKLCVQTVPPSIYPASYPSWIFSRQQFHSRSHKDWQIMVTFDNPDKLIGPVDFIYQGVIIVPNDQSAKQVV